MFAQTSPKPLPVTAFDLVSLKANPHGDGDTSLITARGKLTATNITLLKLLQQAYRLTPSRISRVPTWVRTERYDIVAKTTRTDVKDEDLALLLRPLLVERFKLAFHNENRQAISYMLMPGKAAPDLKPHQSRDKGTDRTTQRIYAKDGQRAMDASKITMAVLAETLTRQIDAPCVDQTGFKGEYDIKLVWSPQDQPSDAAPKSGSSRMNRKLPPILESVQTQLGLRVETTKSSIDVMVIDSIERPRQL